MTIIIKKQSSEGMRVGALRDDPNVTAAKETSPGPEQPKCHIGHTDPRET